MTIQKFTELYSIVYEELYRFAFCMMRQSHDAEDAVSEAVVDAYAEVGKLRDKAAFRSWIFKILSIKCKKKIRGYVNRDDELDETVDAKVFKEAEDIACKVDLRNAFAKLDERERQILTLSVIAGYEGEEVSKIMDMNHNTVRTVKSRALEKMRKLLSV